MSLLRHAREIPRIELLEWTTGVDLLVEDGRVAGATLLDGEGGLRVVQARAVLLASGFLAAAAVRDLRDPLR